ncbi:MAG: geranylgeranylglyceryl/heptaprenylglyceryl phosphate synthase [Flavobacterium sp.]|uniref:geranylgeranylglyceryl/heptaprenylglyceryl phosphate synthase n=1 Tax=Flavobacterium sp. TaxID=239 RepID=UPI0025C0B6BB|nr:geranylgeranylglyceryl/heptaprenylglyceryl phosphate synthase [Flavobacterium sp.]MBA4134131.1 geranylgeranylglyceryl/heptaprenylglyceryl phosphate synthase [Flavobacterium sp.]
MKNIYQDIQTAKSNQQKLLAILLDPDKVSVTAIGKLTEKINQSPASHIFVGGSSFEGNHLNELLKVLKSQINLPIVLFPGNPSQISPEAHGILFLQLLSGRNPEYLIEHQVNAVPILEKTQLEILSTGYILIESGHKTAVERVSQTKPINRDQIDYVAQTAKAGEFIGNKLIYLEAGSGAQQVVSLAMITAVAQRISIPLIVGGGIRSREAINSAFDAGADLVVIGTAFENDPTFFD